MADPFDGSVDYEAAACYVCGDTGTVPETAQPCTCAAWMIQVDLDRRVWTLYRDEGRTRVLCNVPRAIADGEAVTVVPQARVAELEAALALLRDQRYKVKPGSTAGEVVEVVAEIAQAALKGKDAE